MWKFVVVNDKEDLALKQRTGFQDSPPTSRPPSG